MTFYQYLKTKSDDELKIIAFSGINPRSLPHIIAEDRKRANQAYRILRQRLKSNHQNG